MGDTTATRELLDRALASANGVKLTFSSREVAKAYRNQCYAIRRRDAARSRRVYELHEPEHGKSPYDVLSFRLVAGPSLWVGRIEPEKVEEV